jgi:hypothetical protein
MKNTELTLKKLDLIQAEARQLTSDLSTRAARDARVKLRAAVKSKDYAALAASRKAKGSWLGGDR